MICHKFSLSLILHPLSSALNQTGRKSSIGFASCRIHQTLRITLAMAVGISAHVWNIEEITLLFKQKESSSPP
jgi:hypothetical protein